MKTPITIIIGMIALLQTVSEPLDCRGEGTEADIQRAAKKMFEEPLWWVGTNAPSSGDTAALLHALELSASNTNGFQILEEYLAMHTNSPWMPSLRANLASNYRRAGLFSSALEQWEKAWPEVQTCSSAKAQHVGDFILVRWTRLLSNLGRVERLESLMAQTEGRVLDSLDWQTEFNQMRANAEVMRKHPEVSFRCGTFALFEVGRVLGMTNNTLISLRDMDSPVNGFSMAELVRLSDSFHLDLVAVRRAGDEQQLVVPSVVHLKQNHYAAIVERLGDRYRLIDPTFGNQRILPAKTVNAEASGVFLVPKDRVPGGWEPVGAEQLAAVHGKGLDSAVRPARPPCPDAGQTPCDCVQLAGGGPGGSGGGGPGSGGPGSPCTGCGPLPSAGDVVGMPSWRITEPYIATWLFDTPMLYRSSKGTDIPLQINYHSDEGRPNDTNVFGFGPYWNCNWLSYVEIRDLNYAPGDLAADPFFYYYIANAFGAGGGQREYIYSASDGDHNDTSFERIADTNELTSVKIHYPNGSIWTYGLKTPHPSDLGKRRFFLTLQTDPAGRTTTFNYGTNNGVVTLTNVVDLDGRTNVFNYTNASFPTLVTSVQDPYGHEVRFAYDTNRLLTNIVDAIQITNGFAYLYTNGIYLLTNLTTPYGSTHFEYVNPLGTIYGYGTGGDNINRAVRVTEANGAQHVFMYRDYSPTSPDRSNGPFLPCFYTDTPNIGQYYYCPPSTTNAVGINNHNMNFRNSWYWGPRLVPLLSTTDLTLLTQADHNLARLRNWFHSGGTGLGDTISMEREASPDGTLTGQKTFHGFVNAFGQNAGHEEGTNSHPNYTAQLLPNGDTRWTYREFNRWGHMLQEVSTWLNGSSVDTRTNKFEYTSDGIDLLRVYDHGGHLVQSNLFNSLHQVIASRDAVGNWTTNTYDGSGRLTSRRTPAGLTTTNTYDANGFLTKNIDLEILRTNSFTYSNGLVLTRTDERGLTVTNTWDALLRPVSTLYPDGTYTSNRYDKLDLSGSRDRLGNWTYFAYNSMRQRTAITNALTNVTTFAYCTCGSLDNTADAMGNTTYFYYDQAGRPVATAFPDGRWMTNNFNLLGQITNTLDSAGGSTTNWYSNQGLLVAVSNAFGRVQSSVFDIEDRLTNHVSAEGVSLSMAYDDLGRMVWRGYPDGTTELFKYSARGLVAHTNQLSKVTKYGYDAAGRKTAETNANPEMTYFSYNAAGDLLTLTDGKSQVTTWMYDSFGRATNKVEAAGNVIFVYRYDADNRLTNRWTPVKGNTFYAYDAVGNLTGVDYAASPDLAFKYDKLNRMTNMSDAVGTTAFGYTSAGAMEFEDGPWAANRVSYSYTLGQFTGLAVDHLYDSDWQQSYTYDSARRLKTTTSPAGTFTYNYAGAGRMVTNLALGNGTGIQNTFDALARLTATRLTNSSGTELNSHTYLYDQAGRRTNATRVDGSYVRYKYDDIGQVKVAQGYESGGTARLHEQLGYTYDAAGNLNYRTNNALVQTFTVNNLNQLSNATRSGTLTVAGTTVSPATSVTVNSLTATRYGDSTFAKDGFTVTSGTNTFTAAAQDSYGRSDSSSISVYLPATNSFVYDLNGNLLTDGNRHFSYDDENQLTTVIVTNSTKSEFTYDGKMRRRIRKEYSWVSGSWQQTAEVRYVYDGNLEIELRDGNNFTLLNVTRGNDLSGTRQGAGGIGGLLARTDNLQSGSRKHACFHADGNGNVTMLADTLQLIAAKYLYDAFGNCLSAIGPLAEANLYRFSSKEFHVTSGLVYYLYRYYEPQLQRWLNQDPIAEEGGANLYRFVMNNALAFYDRFGLYESKLPPIAPRGPINIPGVWPPDTTQRTPHFVTPRLTPRPLPTIPRTPPAPLPKPPIISAPWLGILCLIFTPSTIGPEPNPNVIHCELVRYDSETDQCIYHCTGVGGVDYVLVKPVDPLTLKCESFDYIPPDR